MYVAGRMDATHVASHVCPKLAAGQYLCTIKRPVAAQNVMDLRVQLLKVKQLAFAGGLYAVLLLVHWGLGPMAALAAA